MAIKLQGTNSVAAPGLTNDGGDGVVVGTDSVDISIGGVSKVNVDSSGNTTVSGKLSTPASTTTRIGATDVTSGTAAGGTVSINAGAARGAGQAVGVLQLLAGRGNNSASNGHIIFGHGDGANGTTVDGTFGRIDSDGLKFNADTAAVNALDDYEEGSFTPTWSNATSTTASSVWRYVKIGNLVTVFGRFQCDTTTNNAAHDVYFSNLPFTSTAALTNNISEYSTSVMTFQVNTDGHTITTYMGAGSTNLEFFQTSDSANWDTLRTSDIANGSRMIVTQTYMTA